MRDSRALIRTSFGEIEERPQAAISMCERPNCAGKILTDYLFRLQASGLAMADGDVPTVVAMLMSSMFGDAILRDVMPHAFPQPESEAASKYVNVVLRALGVQATWGRPVDIRPTDVRSAAGD
jgi:hypothetical protein